MHEFTFAHASDLHFSTIPRHFNPVPSTDRRRWALERLFGNPARAFYPSTYNPERAHLLASYLSKRTDLDALLISGDLATTGSLKDLRAARDYLDGKFPLLGALPTVSLRSADRDLATLPGNHDQFGGPTMVPAGRSNFEAVLGRGWDLDSGWGESHCFESSCAVRVFGLEEDRDDGRDGEGLAIVCADFALQAQNDAAGWWGWLGHGRVYDTTLRELVDATRILGEVGKSRAAIPVVWMVHFPPRFGDTPSELDLLDGERLVAAAAGCGVRHIFAGHRHEQKHYELKDSSVMVICAGSAISVDIGSTGNSILEVKAGVEAGAIVALRWRSIGFDKHSMAFKESSVWTSY